MGGRRGAARGGVLSMRTKLRHSSRKLSGPVETGVRFLHSSPPAVLNLRESTATPAPTGINRRYVSSQLPVAVMDNIRETGSALTQEFLLSLAQTSPAWLSAVSYLHHHSY